MRTREPQTNPTKKVGWSLDNHKAPFFLPTKFKEMKRFIGFLISFFAGIGAFNLMCFLMAGFIDSSSITDLYLFLTVIGMSFIGVFCYMQSYTTFYQKYGIDSWEITKDKEQMSPEAFRKKYNA
jgi:hypothetical protein